MRARALAPEAKGKLKIMSEQTAPPSLPSPLGLVTESEVWSTFILSVGQNSRLVQDKQNEIQNVITPAWRSQMGFSDRPAHGEESAFAG